MTNSRLPSLRGIEAFISAAETLSFKTTSERLHVTVSAISHRVTALEEEIGLRLFDRSKRRLRLTPAGEAYHDRVLPLLNQLQGATQALHVEADSPVLRIASFHLFFEQWLAPRLGDFMAEHPDLRVELATLRHRRSTHPDITIEIIRHGESGADHELLFDLKVAPVCRPELVEYYGLKEPRDVLRARLLEMSQAPGSWPAWMRAAGMEPSQPQSSISVDSPSLTFDLAIAGAGITLWSDNFASYYQSFGLVRPFDIFFNAPNAVYINRPRAFERPIVRAFREWLNGDIEKTLGKTEYTSTF